MKIYHFFSLHLPQEIIDIIYEYSDQSYKLTYNDMITDMNFKDSFYINSYWAFNKGSKLCKISFLKSVISCLNKNSVLWLKKYYQHNSCLLTYNHDKSKILNTNTKRWVKVGGKVYFKIIDNLYTKRIF